MNKEESIKHRKLLAIRTLEDVLLDNLRIKEYRECAGKVTLKLEKTNEENSEIIKDYSELTLAAKTFVKYAKMDLKESEFKSLKNHLKFLEDNIKFNGYRSEKNG